MVSIPSPDIGLGGGFIFFNFHPYLGKISNLTSIFFNGVGSTTNQNRNIGVYNPTYLEPWGLTESHDMIFHHFFLLRFFDQQKGHVFFRLGWKIKNNSISRVLKFKKPWLVTFQKTKRILYVWPNDILLSKWTPESDLGRTPYIYNILYIWIRYSMFSMFFYWHQINSTRIFCEKTHRIFTPFHQPRQAEAPNLSSFLALGDVESTVKMLLNDSMTRLGGGNWKD